MKLSDTLKKVTVVAATGDLQRDITGVNIDSRQERTAEYLRGYDETLSAGTAAGCIEPERANVQDWV